MKPWLLHFWAQHGQALRLTMGSRGLFRCLSLSLSMTTVRQQWMVIVRKRVPGENGGGGRAGGLAGGPREQRGGLLLGAAPLLLVHLLHHLLCLLHARLHSISAIHRPSETASESAYIAVSAKHCNETFVLTTHRADRVLLTKQQ